MHIHRLGFLPINRETSITSTKYVYQYCDDMTTSKDLYCGDMTTSKDLYCGDMTTSMEL